MGDERVSARNAGNERLHTVLELLERGVSNLLDSKGFAAYLRTMARFPSYSARNVALIHFQRPDATRVAGYRAWQALGRQVRRGEKGIRILVPYRRASADDSQADEPPQNVITGFGVGTVFDLAQTDGDPLPAPPAPQSLAGDSALAEWLWDRLAAFAAAEGLALARRPLDRGNGVYWPAGRQIVVKDDLPGDQATKTLAHECGHHVALTSALDRPDGRRADSETIAEGAAFVVLAHIGLDAGAYTFPYVAGWAADRQVLARNLAAIRATAATLIDAIELQAVDAIAA